MKHRVFFISVVSIVYCIHSSEQIAEQEKSIPIIFTGTFSPHYCYNMHKLAEQEVYTYEQENAPYYNGTYEAMHIIASLYFDIIEEINNKLASKTPYDKISNITKHQHIKRLFSSDNTNNYIRPQAHCPISQGLVFDFEQRELISTLGSWKFSEDMVVFYEDNTHPENPWDLVKERMMQHITTQKITEESLSHKLAVLSVAYHNKTLELPILKVIMAS